VIKLKGWMTYNLGKGYYWIRFGDVLITYMHKKEIK
jgi:hypothetical protein